MPSKEEKDTPQEQKPQKSERDILQHTVEAALSQLERPSIGLLLSGFSAGLDIGFSVLLMTVMLTLFNDVIPKPFVDLLVANMYPLGFIFVILGRSELFTEHTTLAVLPVLQGLAGIKKLLQLWVVVYLSNILGGTIFALILSYFAKSIHFLKGWALMEIGSNMIGSDWGTILLSAILAGWLMGLLAWLVAAARETVSQILIIWIITTAIGISGLHHCIVGNVEVMPGLFAGVFSFSEYFRFVGLATLGNILGGVFFVAVLKFTHTAYSGEEKVVDLEDPENK